MFRYWKWPTLRVPTRQPIWGSRGCGPEIIAWGGQDFGPNRFLWRSDPGRGLTLGENFNFGQGGLEIGNTIEIFWQPESSNPVSDLPVAKWFLDVSWALGVFHLSMCRVSDGHVPGMTRINGNRHRLFPTFIDFSSTIPYFLGFQARFMPWLYKTSDPHRPTCKQTRLRML